MSHRIYRYEIPVDDQWHTLRLSGPIVHVDCRDVRTVELWAWAGAQPEHDRELRVYGTGHEIDIPEDEDKWVHHLGTALSPTGPGPFSQPYGQIVWHLVERQSEVTP